MNDIVEKPHPGVWFFFYLAAYRLTQMIDPIYN